MHALNEIGTAELARRWARAERRIRENGITYNVYGDPQGTDRPWKIDMIPLLIPPEQWAEIEAGLIQRAALLSEILTDIYCEQRLVKSGLLPPELLLANPAFLRSMVGAPTPAASYLHLLAVDLARSPDGSPTEPRRPPARAMRLKTASSSPTCCPTSSTAPRCSCSPSSSAPSARLCRLSARSPIRASFSSRRAR
jgi:hypothetical protein